MKTPPPPAPTETLPGVPFYVKTAACKHQTLWLQPVYTLALSVKVMAEEPTTAEDAQSTKSQGASSGATQSHAPGTGTGGGTPTAKNVYNSKDQTVQKLQSLLSEASTTSTGSLQRIKDIFKAWDAITPATYDPLSLGDDETVASPICLRRLEHH